MQGIDSRYAASHRSDYPGELPRAVRVSDTLYYVPSATKPGLAHEVQVIAGYAAVCHGCESFQFRGHCRHLIAVQEDLFRMRLAVGIGEALAAMPSYAEPAADAGIMQEDLVQVPATIDGLTHQVLALTFQCRNCGCREFVNPNVATDQCEPCASGKPASVLDQAAAVAAAAPASYQQDLDNLDDVPF